MAATATALAEIDFDERRLAAWLAEALPDARGPLAIERIGGGQSNPTYFIDAGARRMVLRKRPPGDLPKSAHDVGREYRIIAALHGTDVPVPEPIRFHAASDVVGTPFYLMGRLDGPIFHDASMPEVPRGERRAYYREMARVLAALHAVDWRATDLAGLARPGRYLERQVDRWARAWGALETDDPDVSRVVRWLRANVPDDDTLAIVHGDYKFTNVIYAPDGPRMAGVIDWELCAIGDPLTDLAHIWSFLWETRLDEYGGIMGLDLDALGLPGFEEFADYYYEASPSPRRLTPFHLALAHFRNAGIFHGVAERSAAGNANAGNAEEKGRLDRVYVGRALEVVAANGD